jgi:hypothetical protein
VDEDRRAPGAVRLPNRVMTGQGAGGGPVAANLAEAGTGCFCWRPGWTGRTTTIACRPSTAARAAPSIRGARPSAAARRTTP